MWKLEKHSDRADFRRAAHIPLLWLKPVVVFIDLSNARLRNIVDCFMIKAGLWSLLLVRSKFPVPPESDNQI